MLEKRLSSQLHHQILYDPSPHFFDPFWNAHLYPIYIGLLVGAITPHFPVHFELNFFGDRFPVNGLLWLGRIEHASKGPPDSLNPKLLMSDFHT